MCKVKNKGKYVAPSIDVLIICKRSETIIKEHLRKMPRENVQKFLLNKFFKSVGDVFTGSIMIDHIKSQNCIDNHRSRLCKLVIELYLQLRLFHAAKTIGSKDVYIRQKYTKLILFKGQ